MNSPRQRKVVAKPKPRARAWWAIARAALVTTLAAFTGCGHDPLGWQRIANEHFTLYTDQRPHTYRPVLERLEDVRQGLAASFFDEQTAPPLRVFLFEEGEFHELLGPIGGLFVGQHGKGGTLVVYDGADPKFIDAVAAHELAHGFIGATFRAVPDWYNEGFASYVESIAFLDDKVWFGSINTIAGLEASTGRLIPVAQLFSGGYRDFHGDWERSHYATGWAIVHYVMHGANRSLRSRFDQFGAAVSETARLPNGGAVAWRRVFPDIPLDELDDRLRDHVNVLFGHRHVDSRVGFMLRRQTMPEPRIDPADLTVVDAMRADLRRHRRPDKL